LSPKPLQAAFLLFLLFTLCRIWRLSGSEKKLTHLKMFSACLAPDWSGKPFIFFLGKK